MPNYAREKLNLDKLLHGLCMGHTEQRIDKSKVIETLLAAIEQEEIITAEQESKAIEIFRMY